MITREFYGKTKEEIIENALNILKLKEDQVTIEFKDENSGFPFIKKKLVAKITFDEEYIFGNRCLMFVRDLLEKMNIEAKIYLIEESDEKIVIEIESPDTALIIGTRGKNLEAIQTLVNAVMNKKSQVWSKIIIDIGNYRNRRERDLKYLANKAASQAKRTKESVILEPMNPFERRIIHIALRDEDNIETESQGEGTIKKIKVSCTN
ncbi:MAG: protein jag [Spirochaetes bacterium]|nr:protein jag [Spirochaetota bacterium]